MYRDDETARAAYTAALAREVERVRKLEERVRELQDENRELRARLADTVPQATAHRDSPVFLDHKLVEYIERIVAATNDPQFAHRILSGALPIDAVRIADAARAIAEHQQRHYVMPDDVRQAARDLLPGRILVRQGSTDAVLEHLLESVELP